MRGIKGLQEYSRSFGGHSYVSKGQKRHLRSFWPNKNWCESKRRVGSGQSQNRTKQFQTWDVLRIREYRTVKKWRKKLVSRPKWSAIFPASSILRRTSTHSAITPKSTHQSAINSSSELSVRIQSIFSRYNFCCSHQTLTRNVSWFEIRYYSIYFVVDHFSYAQTRTLRHSATSSKAVRNHSRSHRTFYARSRVNTQNADFRWSPHASLHYLHPHLISQR